MVKASKVDESGVITVKSSLELYNEQETARSEETARMLDAKIQANLDLYEAIAAKVTSEHARAAIFAALVADK